MTENHEDHHRTIMIEALKRGEALFSQGNIEEALQCFQTVVQENPEEPEAINNLAVACMALGDSQAAEKYLLQAMEVKPDYVDAQINLADLYVQTDRLAEAEVLLEHAIDQGLDNPGLLHLLVQVHSRLGHKDKARKLVERSKSLSIGLKLADTFWSAVKYWELAEDLTLRERLEGVLVSCLAAIDGRGSPNIPFRLVTEDGQDLTVVQGLEHLFEEAGEISPRARRHKEKRIKGPGKPLTAQDTDDWHYFRIRLLKEINTEGGCLGDLTQTKKVLAKDERLQKYDPEATIQYLKENLGPCDCHVYRGIEV